jgi:hypothetical protein
MYHTFLSPILLNKLNQKSIFKYFGLSYDFLVNEWYFSAFLLFLHINNSFWSDIVTLQVSLISILFFKYSFWMLCLLIIYCCQIASSSIIFHQETQQFKLIFKTTFDSFKLNKLKNLFTRIISHKVVSNWM